jgi:hypothetical protein
VHQSAPSQLENCAEILETLEERCQSGDTRASLRNRQGPPALQYRQWTGSSRIPSPNRV